MHENITVLRSNGAYWTLPEWQAQYGLINGAIGKHFNIKEARFQQDIKDYGQLVVCAPLIVILDELRKQTNQPVIINSFNRDAKKQKQLKAAGYRTATYSPHVVKMAADIDTKSFSESRDKADLVIEIAKKLKFPVRVGFEDYIQAGQTFIHIDVCPLYFAPGKPFHAVNHPPAWEVPYLTW